MNMVYVAYLEPATHRKFYRDVAANQMLLAYTHTRTAVACEEQVKPNTIRLEQLEFGRVVSVKEFSYFGSGELDGSGI